MGNNNVNSYDLILVGVIFLKEYEALFKLSSQWGRILSEQLVHSMIHINRLLILVKSSSLLSLFFFNQSILFFFLKYLFIYGCVGSSFLCEGFL